MGRVRRPLVHATDRGATLASFRRSRRRSRTSVGPRRDARRRRRVFITGVGVITAVGTGPDGFRAGPPRGASARAVDRSLRRVGVPLAGRGAGRRLRPARPHAARDRPGNSTGSASSGWRPASWRWPTRAWTGLAGRAAAGADRDLPRVRARRHRVRGDPAREVPRARPPSRVSRTSPSRCSAGRHPPTSASRWTCAGRSSRPRTRALAGAVALGEALSAIRDGEIDAAIAGGVEVPLSPLAFGAFDIIRALCHGHNDDPGACVPARSTAPATASSWARARRCWCSRRRTIAEARGATPYAEVMGYGATSDAHHMVQPRPDGREAARAVSLRARGRRRGARRDRLRERACVVHADRRRRRGAGDRRRLGARAATVPVCATKALYGHPLGRLRRDRGGDGDARRPRRLGPGDRQPRGAGAGPRRAAARASCRDGRDGRYERVLSTSFGFGGLNAALVLGATGI